MGGIILFFKWTLKSKIQDLLSSFQQCWPKKFTKSSNIWIFAPKMDYIWRHFCTSWLGWVCELNRFWSLGYLDLHHLMTKPLFPSCRSSPMHSRNLMIYSIMNSQETSRSRDEKAKLLLFFYKDLHFVHSFKSVFVLYEIVE